MVSGYIITEHHLAREHPVPVPNPVAIAWWPPDMHHARRIVVDGKAHNEGFVFARDVWRPFGISWKALVPRRSECANVITPTCPSSSYVGYGSIRILPTFIMLGQATGAMAALSLDNNSDVQDLDYALLQKRLLADGMILEVPENWVELISGMYRSFQKFRHLTLTTDDTDEHR